MVLFTIGANRRRLYRPRPTRVALATIPPPAERPTGGPGSRPPDPDRSATQPMPLAVARSLPRLLPLAVAVALLGAGLVLVTGDPAAAQAAQRRVTIEGTANNTWQPADATVRPGGVVTFQITGGVTHPVLSGDGSDVSKGDGKFDDADCGLAQMAKVGDTCQVRFPKAGTFPYFCQVHVTQGMKGVITVGDVGRRRDHHHRRRGRRRGGRAPERGRPAVVGPPGHLLGRLGPVRPRGAARAGPDRALRALLARVQPPQVLTARRPAEPVGLA